MRNLRQLHTKCRFINMSDLEEISFVIPGYTPETIPLARLLEYIQQIVVVIGDLPDLHLVEIRSSSAHPVFLAPKATVLEANDNVRRAGRGEGTKRQTDAIKCIGQMIQSDAAGTSFSDRPALLKIADKVILEIPAAQEEIGVVDGLRQATSVDGQIIKVGGVGEDAHLQLQAMDGRTLSGITAKRPLAKELALLLWGPTVRLYGEGIWRRDAGGSWNLKSMQVQSYEQLEEDDATLVLERLRALRVDWPKDSIDLLGNEREGH